MPEAQCGVCDVCDGCEAFSLKVDALISRDDMTHSVRRSGFTFTRASNITSTPSQGLALRKG
eukprot:7423988-Pyramimonas_sp.AAC.1